MLCFLNSKQGLLSKPYFTLPVTELGCHGAAIAAGIASGLYKDYQDAVNKTVKISFTIKPNADNKDIYQKKYNNYQNVVESLDSYWQQTFMQ